MGKLHIYCGDGKGKTTASVGLCVRAMGQGYKVVFSQFLKSCKTGEVEVLSNLNDICVLRCTKPLKFTFMMNEQEKQECKEYHNEIFKKAIECSNEEKTLIVFDELLDAINENLIEFEMVYEFLKSKPCCEVVLTGRNPKDELVNLADYVTEMKKHKHPYDQNVDAREGIEF